MYPNYLDSLGYTGQIPKMEVQCGLTYDSFEDEIIPLKTDERLWIERHAASIRTQIDNSKKAGLPLYPFTDVLVLPVSLLEKYDTELKIDEKFSIKRKRTQQILRAQITEIFERFPDLDGLTIRHGETYVHDTPYHKGETPVRTAEEHAIMINILKEEICLKRNKKLFYRTWDFGWFHTQPKFYLDATNPIEPHPLLFFCIKHVNYDFNRGYPFNTTIGLGKHQQIIEVSMNQAGCYGNNSHPYYIGKGIIEHWSEMEVKKGLIDLYEDSKIKGVWTWTGGDGWVGPYFDNELWMDLNEYIIRTFVHNPKKTEEDIFMDYAINQLKLSDLDAKKFRQLNLLSTDAVYYGQASKHFFADTWWCRDHYLSAIDLKEVVRKEIIDKVLNEKEKNLENWYLMEKLAQEITIPKPELDSFLKVSTTYGRIKYEIMAIIWKIQIAKAKVDLKRPINHEKVQEYIKDYRSKWQEWVQLKKDYPNCPTLYVDHTSMHTNEPFQETLIFFDSFLKS
ncbi:hypothetical protein [Croceivirga radicis]|uniref:hypothetical protein n=1 Tax=Croceivirga radicis TaxID=1929488 RepID=UPI001FD54599|nr:hypothetical protein [Croceivirga radicis]